MFDAVNALPVAGGVSLTSLDMSLHLSCCVNGCTVFILRWSRHLIKDCLLHVIHTHTCLFLN